LSRTKGASREYAMRCASCVRRAKSRPRTIHDEARPTEFTPPGVVSTKYGRESVRSSFSQRARQDSKQWWTSMRGPACEGFKAVTLLTGVHGGVSRFATQRGCEGCFAAAAERAASDKASPWTTLTRTRVFEGALNHLTLSRRSGLPFGEVALSRIVAGSPTD